MRTLVCDVESCGKPAVFSVRYHLFVREDRDGENKDADATTVEKHACSLDHGDALLEEPATWFKKRFDPNAKEKSSAT